MIPAFRHSGRAKPLSCVLTSKNVKEKHFMSKYNKNKTSLRQLTEGPGSKYSKMLKIGCPDRRR